MVRVATSVKAYHYNVYVQQNLYLKHNIQRVAMDTDFR